MFIIGGATLVALLVLTTIIAISLRVVVPTNMVHIVQRRKNSTSYGQGKDAGNIYYKWPGWIPFFGVYVTTLPESVFQIALNGYDAYDQGRLPFLVDVRAFFRVADSQTAAQRVSNFADLENQLLAVLQGAVRRVLATSHLENIMQDRSGLGKLFTEEVDEQLKEWGVCNVKAIEFMDIRDSQGSTVIHDIMAKEKSRIAQESRVAVATNERIAQLAEIEARQIADVRKQEAEQLVGLRTAEKEKEVGIATEKAKQETEAQAKVTAERSMDVQQVKSVRQAEISKQTAVIAAEASAQAKVKEAEGNLEATLKTAEGVSATGKAQGEAETARLMAPVNSQIALADKIGKDESYQKYLVTVRQVEANEAVGKEMASALKAADLKVIANAGDATTGMTSLGSAISPAGGVNVGGFLTALSQSEEGKQILDAITSKLGDASKKKAS